MIAKSPFAQELVNCKSNPQLRMFFESAPRVVYDGFYGIRAVSGIFELSSNQVLDLTNNGILTPKVGPPYDKSDNEARRFGPYHFDSLVKLASLFGVSRENFLLDKNTIKKADMVSRFEAYSNCRRFNGVKKTLEENLQNNHPKIDCWQKIDYYELKKLLGVNPIILDELAYQGFFMNMGKPTRWHQRFDVIHPGALAYLIAKVLDTDLHNIFVPGDGGHNLNLLRSSGRRRTHKTLGINYAIPIQLPNKEIFWFTLRAQETFLKAFGFSTDYFSGEHLDYLLDQVSNPEYIAYRKKIVTPDIEISVASNNRMGAVRLRESISAYRLDTDGILSKKIPGGWLKGRNAMNKNRSGLRK